MKSGILIVLFAFFFGTRVEAREQRLKFNLKFGVLKGGEAELTVKDTVFNGKPAIHYYVLGRTTGLAEKLYGVYDIYETTVDAQTRLPLKTIRNVKEGSYSHYNETLFFHENDSIFSQKKGGRKVPHNLVDLISVFFYFGHVNQLEKMAPGDGATYPTINADDISNVSVKFLREDEAETDIGNIKCYVISPTVKKGKVLKRSDGLLIFISKEKQLPINMVFEMRVGSLKAVIKSYTIDGVEQKIR